MAMVGSDSVDDLNRPAASLEHLGIVVGFNGDGLEIPQLPPGEVIRCPKVGKVSHGTRMILATESEGRHAVVAEVDGMEIPSMARPERAIRLKVVDEIQLHQSLEGAGVMPQMRRMGFVAPEPDAFRGHPGKGGILPVVGVRVSQNRVSDPLRRKANLAKALGKPFGCQPQIHQNSGRSIRQNATIGTATACQTLKKRHQGNPFQRDLKPRHCLFHATRAGNVLESRQDGSNPTKE